MSFLELRSNCKYWVSPDCQLSVVWPVCSVSFFACRPEFKDTVSQLSAWWPTYCVKNIFFVICKTSMSPDCQLFAGWPKQSAVESRETPQQSSLDSLKLFSQVIQWLSVQRCISDQHFQDQNIEIDIAGGPVKVRPIWVSAVGRDRDLRSSN